jgi:hypothetical protein
MQKKPWQTLYREACASVPLITGPWVCIFTTAPEDSPTYRAFCKRKPGYNPLVDPPVVGRIRRMGRDKITSAHRAVPLATKVFHQIYECLVIPVTGTGAHSTITSSNFFSGFSFSVFPISVTLSNSPGTSNLISNGGAEIHQ